MPVHPVSASQTDHCPEFWRAFLGESAYWWLRHFTGLPVDGAGVGLWLPYQQVEPHWHVVALAAAGRPLLHGTSLDFELLAAVGFRNVDWGGRRMR